MSAEPLLTLAIPTYNRLAFVRLLLERVLDDVAASGGAIEVLVCDNDSTDGAPAYLEGLAANGRIRLLRQASNVGADRNILSCLREARGRFAWVCGDDDLPLPGTLLRVVRFLRAHDPDLLYLPARWHDADLGALRTQPASSREPVQVDAMELALLANAFVTFISSWVFNRDRYLSLAGPEAAGRYVGTSLVQLEWHLGLLTAGGALYAAREPWLLARSGNTGGYSLFDTFVVSYHRILGEKLREQPQVRDLLQQHLLRGYLPGLVWALRMGLLGRFDEADWGRVEAMLERTWPRQPQRRAWLRRILHWPRPLAKMAMGVCWLDARMWARALTLHHGGRGT